MTAPVICLLGPTASGKTATVMALVDALAKVQPLALISVDSALVYRGLDIGTAKPSPAQLARYPHALIDICDPAEPFTVADFLRLAEAEVVAALARGALPVLVGGTMMYFQAFVQGLADIPPIPAAVRQQLQQELVARGNQALYQELLQADPVAAARIHPNNPQRLVRALEVWRHTGVPISSYWARQQQQAPAARRGWTLHQLALLPDWTQLQARIAARLEAMLAAGLVAEVAALRARGDLDPALPALRAVGYRQVWNYLAGACSYQQMQDQALKATRDLAKRQRTWLRHWPNLVQFSADEQDLGDAILKYMQAVAIVPSAHNKGVGCL